MKKYIYCLLLTYLLGGASLFSTLYFPEVFAWVRQHNDFNNFDFICASDINTMIIIFKDMLIDSQKCATKVVIDIFKELYGDRSLNELHDITARENSALLRKISQGIKRYSKSQLIEEEVSFFIEDLYNLLRLSSRCIIDGFSLKESAEDYKITIALYELSFAKIVKSLKKACYFDAAFSAYLSNIMMEIPLLTSNEDKIEPGDSL